jgi:Zn-dependent membrane protease YugP
LRSTILPVASIGSNVGPWLIFIGMFIGAASVFGQFMLMAGVILFAGATLFTVITVPVEFNASARAKEKLLTLGVINRGEEEDAVKGVLTAAGLTYLAAAVTSILWLLYYLMRSGLLGGRSED